MVVDLNLNVKSWRIYRDFKYWSSTLSDRTIATYSISALAVLSFVTFLSLIPKRKHKTPLLPKSQLRHFVATSEWKVVDSDHICPSGLEFKIDLSTGMKIARKIAK